MSRGPKKLSLWPTQQAIYERLSTDVILMTMITDVYDEVDEDAARPYIKIGDYTNNPYDTKTNYGDDSTVTLHIWTSGPGKTEALKIMDVVAQSLTAAPLEIPGFKFDGLELEFTECLEDDTTYHGICRFRIYSKQL